MKYIVEKLTKSEELENKIKVLCSFKSIKFNVKQGRIISIENTNICFIVPHKIILDINKYKILLLYFDNDNLFLYDRRIPINIRKLENIISKLKNR